MRGLVVKVKASDIQSEGRQFDPEPEPGHVVYPWERYLAPISSVHPAVFKMGTGRKDSERIVGCLKCRAY